MVQKATEQVFLLHLQLQGRSLNRQAGKAAILETGDFTLCDSSRPYSLEFNDPNNMLVLRIPAPFLRRFIASPEDVVSRHMPGDRGMSAVVSSLLQGHWRNSIEDINPASQQALEESLLNLLTLAYTERMSLQTQDTSPHDALRQRIQLYIDQNAGFLELTPELIANAHGISKRYLHKLFSEAGLTVGRYLLECRLNRARTLLEQTGHQNSIESIGFEAGFSNASYFNRAFKSRFGMTPRQYRSSLLN
jgi:AraC-like DNA-binding protein